MHTEISTINGVSVLTVGERSLTVATVDAVRRQAAEKLSASGGRWILDLGPVEYMDSSGAGLLVSLHKSVQAGGKLIRLAGLSGQPLSLVRMVNLDRLLPLSRDVGEALDAMGGAPADPAAREAEPGTAEWRALEAVDRLMARFTLFYETQLGGMPERTASVIRRELESAVLGRAREPDPVESTGRWPLRTRMMLRLAEGLVHRLGGILSLVQGRAQFLRMVGEDEAVKGSLDVVERACRWGTEELRRFRSFSRGPAAGRPERASLRRILDESVDGARVIWEERQAGRSRSLRVIREFAGHPEVFADASRLRTALQEILVNAAEAMPDGGVISLSLTQGGGDAVVTVSDTGPGIREQDLEKLFQPGFTTKGSPGGGLGLALARHVVRACGGEIAVESEPGRGTNVRVRIPNVAGLMLHEPPGN
jgi:anti-anti-sigma factor